MRVRLRLRLRLRQIATLRLWDVASNAKNGYTTHSLRLTQIMQKSHSVNGPLNEKFRSHDAVFPFSAFEM